MEALEVELIELQRTIYRLCRASTIASPPSMSQSVAVGETQAPACNRLKIIAL